MEYIHILMEPDMKENGKMINKMAMVKKFGLMALLMKDNMSMEKNKVQVLLNGQINLYIEDNLQIIIYMEKENIYLLMEENMMEIG